MTDPAEHRASMEAAKAWNWLKKAKARTFEEWKKVGEGFLAGRAWAKRKAGIVEGINQPIDHRLGRGYNEKFAEWLNAYGLADIDQADRSNLLKLMDSPAVLAWRSGLPQDKRDALNHPTTILRAYNRKFKEREREPAGDDDDERKTAKQSALEAAGDAYQALRKENVQLRLNARKHCDVDLLHSDIEKIEEWLRMRVLKPNKAERIRDVLVELYPIA
jgi:hypothetical protein